MTSRWTDDDLTRDAFLGGRVQVWQPKSGYRAGADAVILAAAVPAKPGQSVLELGAGVGVASLCLTARVAGLNVMAVERDVDTADLCRRNAEAAGVDIVPVVADIAGLPDDLRARSFDHVMMNPPYFDSGTRAPDGPRSGARHEDMPLDQWISAGLRRLHPGGCVTLIHRAERLPDILSALSKGAGSVRVTPLVGRPGFDAGRVIVRAKKAGKAPFSLEFPLILHEGASHDADRDSYSDAARSILRNAAALDDVRSR